ncbi:hypothetical protein ACFSKW_18490 [Nonomuraea mangrovi]|uniref:MmyB-like transcription regulator ligand binding domain-containing protein n=1 Tax=Nonomuraea mangrovi TaxID=2316207 RepID=A0ABW4SYS6_9ACTN
MSSASREFRQIWAEHDIKAPEHGSHLYRHPLVGELQLTYETLRLPGHPDLALVVHTAEEGSPSQEALRILIRRHPYSGTHAEGDTGVVAEGKA